jgi:hypothetical protein
MQTPYASALDLLPPFRLVTLCEVGDAFARAHCHAAELVARSLVFVGRFDLAEFAVVLEPEEPLATARRAFYAGMVAPGDALVAMVPPKRRLRSIGLMRSGWMVGSLAEGDSRGRMMPRKMPRHPGSCLAP